MMNVLAGTPVPFRYCASPPLTGRPMVPVSAETVSTPVPAATTPVNEASATVADFHLYPVSTALLVTVAEPTVSDTVITYTPAPPGVPLVCDTTTEPAVVP